MGDGNLIDSMGIHLRKLDWRNLLKSESGYAGEVDADHRIERKLRWQLSYKGGGSDSAFET